MKLIQYLQTFAFLRSDSAGPPSFFADLGIRRRATARKLNAGRGRNGHRTTTLLSLSLSAGGCGKGEPDILLSLEETPRQMRWVASHFGWDEQALRLAWGHAVDDPGRARTAPGRGPHLNGGCSPRRAT